MPVFIIPSMLSLERREILMNPSICAENLAPFKRKELKLICQLNGVAIREHDSNYEFFNVSNYYFEIFQNKWS
jgi:tRNA(Ile)-lysidine synthase TilS/MesJ